MSVFHKSFTVVVLFSLGNKTLFCCSISAKRWKISSFFLQTCNLVSMEDLFSLIGQACDKIAHLFRESYYKRPYYVFNLDFLNFHYSWVKQNASVQNEYDIWFSSQRPFSITLNSICTRIQYFFWWCQKINNYHPSIHEPFVSSLP